MSDSEAEGEDLQRWSNRLANHPLPAMARTMQGITRLLNAPSTTNADFQRLINRDPGFTLSVFRHFSKAGRQPREPVTTLAHAIAMLGLDPVISGSKQLPILKEVLAGSARQGLYDCYSRAGHAAWYAHQWGEFRKDGNPEEMAIAALLHECGEMALWSQAEDEMLKIQARIEQGTDRQSAALEVLGCTLDQLSLNLARRWLLPPLTAESLVTEGYFQNRPLGVRLAVELARCSEEDWRSDPLEQLLELLPDYLRMTADVSRALTHQLCAEAARSLEGLPLRVSAVGLMQLATPPGPEPASVTPTSDKPAGENGADAEVPDQQGPRTPDSPAADGAGGNATQAAKPATGNRLQQQLQHTFKEIHQLLGDGQILLAMLTTERKQLRAKFVTGAPQDAPIRHFLVDLTSRHLFSAVMSKPQGFWLNAGNREKYLPLIPAEIRDTIRNDGFFISSLYVKNRPVGLLYADVRNPETLDEAQFSQFKQLAQRLCNALGQK